MSFMKYKGYRAKIEYEEEDQIFHGVVVNILDTISFYGKSVDELTDAFRESVDGYIAFCRERGEQPEKPYSGKFQLRMPPHLHQLISLAAKTQGVSLNTFITEHMQEALGFEYEREPNEQKSKTQPMIKKKQEKLASGSIKPKVKAKSKPKAGTK